MNEECPRCGGTLDSEEGLIFTVHRCTNCRFEGTVEPAYTVYTWLRDHVVSTDTDDTDPAPSAPLECYERVTGRVAQALPPDVHDQYTVGDLAGEYTILVVYEESLLPLTTMDKILQKVPVPGVGPSRSEMPVVLTDDDAEEGEWIDAWAVRRPNFEERPRDRIYDARGYHP